MSLYDPQPEKPQTSINVQPLLLLKTHRTPSCHYYQNLKRGFISYILFGNGIRLRVGFIIGILAIAINGGHIFFTLIQKIQFDDFNVCEKLFIMNKKQKMLKKNTFTIIAVF